MPTQRGGGSVGQSLQYVDPAAPERSAPAGVDLLKESQSNLIARPAIGGGGCGTRKRKGGFYPSVMSGVVNAGVVMAPLTAFAARKLFSRKHRRGGGKRGNLLRAQKEEARAQLEVIGKPSGPNVAAFVAAKRRGSDKAEEFLTEFRKRKQEKAEANEAKRRAQAEKKATRNAKKAEKAAEKAAKKATKKAKKNVKAAAAVIAKLSNRPRSNTSSNNNNNSERAPTQAQLRREAEENAARAKAELKAAKAKRPVKNSQVAWFTLVKNARTKLAANGVPTQKNAMKYASLLRDGKNAEAEEFLRNFRGRSRKVAKSPEAATGPSPFAAAGNNAGRPSAAAASAAVTKKVKKTAAPSAAAASAAPTKKVKKTAANASGNGEPKKRKSPSPGQKAYFEALRTARERLSALGKFKPANMAKWASLKVSKKSNAANSLAAFEQNFRTRVAEAPAAPAKASKAPKKALTAVAEAKENENENENENNMQGYEENFHSNRNE